MRLRFWLGALLAMPAVCGLAQTVREKVRVGVIRISVSAQTSSKAAVRDLKAEDLSLQVDGQLVPIDSLTVPSQTNPQMETVTKTQSDVGFARPADEGISAIAPDPVQLAILVDEGGTKSFDREDVYKQLGRLFRGVAPATRSTMIARFNGGKLDVLCPWTEDSERAAAAFRELAAHGKSSRVLSAQEIFTASPEEKRGLGVEILFARDRLFRNMLLMIAAFPPSPARRMLVLVTGGTALLSPPDFAAAMDSGRSAAGLSKRSERSRLEESVFDVDEARTSFQLWSDMSRRSWHSKLADVMAKAQEKDVALVSIQAEDAARDTNPGADGKWPVRAMPGLTSLPASSGLSPRWHAGQTMTTMAIQTGGDAILAPFQTADRLTNMQAVEPYLLTFRDPFPEDHRSHRLEIRTARRGVVLRYRHGYRTPTEEDELLDRLMTHLVRPAPGANPLSATVTIDRRSDLPEAPLHLACRYQPPQEHGLESDLERNVELLLAAEDDAGSPSDPARWAGAARRIGETATFAVDFDLKLPPRAYRWSVAVRDVPTGVVSYVETTSRQ